MWMSKHWRSLMERWSEIPLIYEFRRRDDQKKALTTKDTKVHEGCTGIAIALLRDLWCPWWSKILRNLLRVRVNVPHAFGATLRRLQFCRRGGLACAPVPGFLIRRGD